MNGLKVYQTEKLIEWNGIVWMTGAVFLFLTCTARLGVLFSSNTDMIQFLGLTGIALCLVPVFRPASLKVILFCFALTFPLYGSFPYSRHSFLFELYLSFLSLGLCIQIFKAGSFSKGKGLLQSVLFLYAILSCASLLLLPVRNMGWQLILWDWNIFWNAVYSATPESPLYSIAALNRLILYILFSLLLSGCREAKELYRAIFTGLFVAAFWASVIGIFEHYNLLNLDWFRAVEGKGLRLQSVFANPGWFAEFLTITIPFSLLAFLSSGLNKVKRLCLFGLLIVCEIAVILSYSRTGWLIFPLILVGCWLFFYIANRSETRRFAWKQMGKLGVQVLTVFFLALCICYFFIFHVAGVLDTSGVKESSRLTERVSEIINPTVRKVIWAESLEMVQEKPLFGLGYESFKLHNTILKKVKKQWDTPHNFYLQLLVNGGIAGLVLWGILISATLYILIADLVKNRTYLNIAAMLSIVAFHLFGLTQAMQYIPIIWFLVFISIGFAMSVNKNVLPDWVQKKQSAFVWMLSFVVLVAALSYASDFESKRLAAKEKIKTYSLDQEQENYLGFYPPERWPGEGIYRWTGTSAIIKLPRAEMFGINFFCGAPDLADDPLVVSIYEGDRLIDAIYFSRQESVKRQYYIPRARLQDKKLYIRVSRTWNLKKIGVAEDLRNLGVAISRVKVIEEMPAQGIGFYNWEEWQGSPLPGGTDTRFQYRWTGPQAVFNPQNLDSSRKLYFRAGQPGLPAKPLFVEIRQDGEFIKSLQLADTNWHGVTLDALTDFSKPCIIKVARTWNPVSTGTGIDSRTLGVAVAGLTRGDFFGKKRVN